MYVLGIGLIFARGMGVESFEKALLESWQDSAYTFQNSKSPAFQVDLGVLRGKSFLKKIRRSDKFSKMSVLAASEALSSAGVSDSDGRRIGLIVATAFGPHVTTFSFLDDIIDYGDGSVSPTTFSNSVHNAAASYVAESLNIQGPTITVTQFFHSFHNALRLAQLWLKEGRCEHVLVGAVDQFGDVLQYIYNIKLTSAPDGRIRPFNFFPTYQVPGEGAAFFLLSDSISGESFCNIKEITDGQQHLAGVSPDVNLIDADGLLPDESVYASALSSEVPTAAYSPIFGSMMIGSAFNCAAGALMLKNQIVYANPVMENPHGLNLVSETSKRHFDIIACTRFNCNHDPMTIYLTKT